MPVSIILLAWKASSVDSFNQTFEVKPQADLV